MSAPFLTALWPLLLWTFAHTAADENECPDKLPIQREGICFGLQMEMQRAQDAESGCNSINSKSHLAQLPNMDVLDEVVGFVAKFIQSKLAKAYFWLGLRRYVEPPGAGGQEKKKKWEWNYDETVVEEDKYQMWAETPSDGLSCSAVNGSMNFDVLPVDCGGPRLPCLCMRSTTDPCTESGLPYLMYDDICAGVVAAALEYKYAVGACLKGELAPYKDEDTKRKLMMAIHNYFLGGGIYVGLTMVEKKKFIFADSSQPEPEWWEPGEPRGEGDCVGLSVQPDWSLKLKTMDCGMMAFSLCSYEDESNLFPDDNFTSPQKQ